MGNPNDGPAPPTWKFMLVQYLGLLPALLIVSYGIDALPIDPPLWLKLIMETMIVVPFMHYVITPTVDRVFSDWLYKGVDVRQRHK